MGQQMQELIRRADGRRVMRARSRAPKEIAYDTERDRWSAVVGGSGGEVWNPVITLGDRRSFYCDCPDHKRNANKYGPCKHVIALAQAVAKVRC